MTRPPPNGTQPRFGTELVIDLADCNRDVITDPDAIRYWLRRLCRDSGMNAYGDPQVVHFGKGHLAGLTGVQLIDTSNINIHCVDADGSAYINFFTCGHLNAAAAASFTARTFGATHANATILTRRPPTTSNLHSLGLSGVASDMV